MNNFDRSRTKAIAMINSRLDAALYKKDAIPLFNISMTREIHDEFINYLWSAFRFYLITQDEYENFLDRWEKEVGS